MWYSNRSGSCRSMMIQGAVWCVLMTFNRASGWSLSTAKRRRPLLTNDARIHVSSSCLSARRPRRQDDVYDPYQEETTSFETSRPYWEEEPGTEEEFVSYQEYREADVLEWEPCPDDEAGTAHVLLPPSKVDRPSVILHFVGGTFFGSAPSVWYRQLLTDLVRHTQAAVVATSIPVTVMQSPLQHVQLAQKIRRQFQTAWWNVLVDEYGQDALAGVPVCGLGHSLGARLLVVLATLQSTQQYKSFILMSFTNHRAAAGIPGIAQLIKTSQRLEQQEDDQDDDEVPSSWREERRRNGARRRRRRRDDWWDDEDDDDWGELLQDLRDSVRKQTNRVRTALTPAAQDLEFYPTPEQLWTALTENARYTVKQTLVVQFDDDEVDQSAKLASCLKATSDVKFSRLRGTHLTPVSTHDSSGQSRKAVWQQVNDRVGRTLVKLLLSGRRRRPNKEALQDLRQTIARYITEVVTKE